MRGIVLEPDHIKASVQGDNEIDDRIPLLKRIRIHYDLQIPPGSRETVDRALERHVSKCPTARSLAGAVEVEWTAHIRESEPGDGP
ncbi:MAG: OsmC family protein [Gemmatimonadetes bacterium]|nr:OsmC family protein [Gemmatimonadota bacterium]